MLITSAASLSRPSRNRPEVLIPEYFGRQFYDVASGRFDPVGLRYALLLREMTPERLAHEAGICRSSAYKALKGDGVGHRIAIAILGALGRHPRSLPSID
jgi:hypothetical protein